MVRPLTPKQARFVAEYLVDLNATQAAIRAGYSAKTAFIIGHENLKKPAMAAAIRERQEALAKKLDLSAERVLMELSRIAFADVRQLFDGQGQLKAVPELPPELAAAVRSMTRRSVTEGGSTREQVQVRLWDKVAALTLLCKHLGLFESKVEVGGVVELRWKERAQGASGS
jgi:phage terminase small subunit